MTDSRSIFNLALRIRKTNVRLDNNKKPIHEILEEISSEIKEIDKLLEQIKFYMDHPCSIKQEELDKFANEMINTCKRYFEREFYGFDSFSKLNTLKIKLEQKKNSLYNKRAYINVLFDKNTNYITDELIKLEDIYLKSEEEFNDLYLQK